MPGADSHHESTPSGDSAVLRDLVQRSSSGNEAAFAELYDLTSSRLYGLVLRVLRGPDLAAEVVQEVYLEIWRRAAEYRDESGSVMAWMCTIAHRRAVDRVRSVQKQTDRDQRWHRLSDSDEVDEVWSDVERNLDVERVRKGLEQLPEGQREALTLAYYRGYSQTQIATALDLPLGTTKSRIRDGLIRLRDTLGVQT
ncbi:ECF RNA polymerase sigma factor SigK [Aestuariimicrobium sp. T2.26MG-19.2B]|uniref:ECF RNA polymerase sigma factor SigK n=1 Tax=Aestuariimicrobium sp. T2.26MG-19.2B TaxID=3040679 RepID=UPI0024773A43|nr:ECF RNA polymerase sigma factor SigK [Aestuariimicrobium sp. T2.26MG-19.2B]CAI9403395.1 ECF RNA polymerase sigma factor SigK [Aestuariimicrobium sp. T2.26MG-19.2B]